MPGQGTGNQDRTLREAINAANAYGDGAVIDFSVSGTIVVGLSLPQIMSPSDSRRHRAIGDHQSGNDTVKPFSTIFG